MVRDSGSKGDICPNCAGDLHPTGDFCPHCAVRVRGNILTCHKCGKPVVEGSAYCPSCGSVFKPLGEKSVLEPRTVMLIITFLSVAIAILYRPLFVVFIIFAGLALGAWVWDLFVSRMRVSQAIGREEKEKAEEAEDEKRERKSV